MKENLEFVERNVDKLDLSGYEVIKRDKIRTAGYIRRALDLEDFDEAVLNLETLIKDNPKWEFVEVYQDRNKSGANIEGRPGFMQMMKDAEEWKIDLIVVESVHQFSRNILQFLQSLRKLLLWDVRLRIVDSAITLTRQSGDLLLQIAEGIMEEERQSKLDDLQWRRERKK